MAGTRRPKASKTPKGSFDRPISLADEVHIDHPQWVGIKGVVVSLSIENRNAALVEWNDSQRNGWFERSVLRLGWG